MKKLFWNFILILNFYLILYFWLSHSGANLTSGEPGDIYIALGRLTGLLSAYLILIQLVLISRFSLIEREYGFDKLNYLHRIIGFTLGVFIISHPVLLILGYAAANQTSAWTQFMNFQTKWHDIFSATVAFLIIILTALISLKAIRRRVPYEFWYFAHLPLYVAIAISFEHQTRTGDLTTGGALWYWFGINLLAVGLLLVYRFLRPTYHFWRQGFKVEKVVRESDTVYSVYIIGRQLTDYKFSSGQYATLIFLQSKLWFHHPFSFSDTKNDQHLRFTVKALGDFSNQLSELRMGTRVWIDGPLGTFTLAKAQTKRFLFIAGGIGLTPILSLIKSRPNNTNALLLYSNKTEAEVIFRDELAAAGIKTHYFFTSQGSENRISVEKIRALCPDFRDRDIYICGPERMMTDLLCDLKAERVPSAQLHAENFNY